MPWPPHIIIQFQTVTEIGLIDGSLYYGPYNGLLNVLFPGDEGFMIVPPHKRPRHPQAIDSTMVYVVQHDNHPVFFIEIRPSGHLHKLSDRADADEQMRERFESFTQELSIPKLYGISALGTKICLYKYEVDAQVLFPERIERDPELINDTAPIDRWDFNVLEEDGERRLRELVSEIKQMCL
jgi:hypothetical protein